jgi:protein SCO1/2
MKSILLKENLKTALSIIILIAVLFFSYLKDKQVKEFNPFILKLNSNAGVVTLNELKQNKIVLLYFGFLSCPDACPTTLTKMSAVFKEIPTSSLEKISFLFVDLDPERDNLQQLSEYTKYFHSKITPIALDLTNLDHFTKFFGITYTKVLLKSTMGYTIDHSTDILVLSADGKIIERIEHVTPKNQIVLKLNKIISELK